MTIKNIEITNKNDFGTFKSGDIVERHGELFVVTKSIKHEDASPNNVIEEAIFGSTPSRSHHNALNRGIAYYNLVSLADGKIRYKEWLDYGLFSRKVFSYYKKIEEVTIKVNK